MVLCEIFTLTDNFLMLYLIMAAASVFSIVFIMSGPAFVALYMFPSYKTWQWKTLAAYPKPEVVGREIVQTIWGACVAVMMPAISVYLSSQGQTKGYCGLGKYGYWYDFLQFFIFVFVSDLYEWTYHYLGHKYDALWTVHKFHHNFHNPTPFAVIADCAMDNICRAAPLLFFPLLMPTNLDILFFTYVIFFYIYGVYLHSGHEVPFISAHHPWINSSYHHCAHHAISIKNRPLYTGFFFKFWDNLAGSRIEKEESCFCVRCETKKGNRTEEKWKKLEKPDYSVLLTIDFWRNFENSPKMKKIQTPSNFS